MKEVWLVSCVSRKQAAPSLAKDLYISPWFRKARLYLESQRQPWFILSAKYGLLAPDIRVSPYEESLTTKSREERRLWSIAVFLDLIDFDAGCYRFLAGTDYREFLVPMLEQAGKKTLTPLSGLTIGKQLQWFDRHSPSSGFFGDIATFPIA